MCGGDRPGSELASRQQRRYGGMLAFELGGGREAEWQFIDATVLMSLTANLGDAKTTVVHPATTTHGRLSKRGKRRVFIRVWSGLQSALRTLRTFKSSASAVLRLPTEPEQPSDDGSTIARKPRFLLRRPHR